MPTATAATALLIIKREPTTPPIRLGVKIRRRSGVKIRCRLTVDIYETETGVVVAADLPGVNSDGLEVTLEKRVLSIYGHVDEEVPEGYSLVYREYEVGDFERQFALSGDFNINGIEADLRDGMLHLAIPRAPEPEAKRIEVRASS